ncbi:hypothetical protein PSI23_11955 [Xenorhabdus sp. XENO-10]|uniref:Uncharacterized protein n=1 Tax=Xenorhabdus yunnanensis TaxID=3025878 RepID=A0ABT5LJP3_9GAMM|nr:hypothetical protein [Xenorhabdus yunnanensis]MDC9589995.1 hypothetical protein [Xenorhabdus yunnanensis]
MHKNTVDSNDVGTENNSFTVEGDVSFLDVPYSINNITVTVIGDRSAIYDAHLYYDINESIGEQLLTVLELSIIYKKKVRVFGEGKAIKSVAIYK